MCYDPHMKKILTVCLLFFACSSMAADTFDLSVTITKIHNAKGSIRIALYQTEDSWMELPEAHRKLAKPAKKGTVNFVFTALKKGTYGYAIFHDANDNQELDMQWLPPKPVEGVGASNNAEGSFGPPDWEDSRFVLDKKLSHSVHMTYM
jgi:uncharacterized protein (DUF2141 family)